MEHKTKISAASPHIKPRHHENDMRKQTSIQINDQANQKSHIIKISTSANKNFLNIELTDHERPFSFDVQE